MFHRIEPWIAGYERPHFLFNFFLFKTVIGREIENPLAMISRTAAIFRHPCGGNQPSCDKSLLTDFSIPIFVQFTFLMVENNLKPDYSYPAIYSLLR